MKENDRIAFEISGSDYDILIQFQQQHSNCAKGFTGEQFLYSFTPTSLGVIKCVRCSCGQELLLGDILDHSDGEYDPEKHRVLTPNDHENKRFEEAAIRILNMRDPRFYRMAFQTEQSFEMIYIIAAYGIAQVSDERIPKCILWKHDGTVYGNKRDNYNGLGETEKIDEFFNYFVKHARGEVAKYDCRNEKLLKLLES